MKTGSLGSSLGGLHSGGVGLNVVRYHDKRLVTLEPGGVDHLEGGGPHGSHRDGPEQLDIAILVVEREESSRPLVVPEEVVNVSATSHREVTQRRSLTAGRNVRVGRRKTGDRNWVMEQRKSVTRSL